MNGTHNNEWLDVIIDGRMAEINSKGEVRFKHTYFVNGGATNATVSSIPHSKRHTKSKTKKGKKKKRVRPQ